MSYEELTVHDVKRCRMPHRCQWCAEEIAKGAPAVYRACIYEGDFCSDHFHPECWDACGRYATAVPDDEVSWFPGDFLRGSAISRDGGNYETSGEGGK